MWFIEYLGYFWIVVAIMFLFAEMNTPGLFFFVSFAAGAICASVLAFLGYSLITQCVAGMSVTIVVFFLMRKYLKQKKMSEVTYESAHTNIDALARKCGLVVAEIGPHSAGRVKIGGEVWRARGDGGVEIKEDVLVCVLRVEGNTLIVKPEKPKK
jgi:membrane protein implicated in regulation of membrane protease activity